ncbi:MAG: hypothetical protein R3F47_00955 [Gammaproteobacteria bacterium]
MSRRNTVPFFIGGTLLLAALPAALQAQTGTVSSSEFNPAISLILDGYYADYHDEFELPGFQLGGEAGLPEKGFGLGHSELSISANIDDRFYGSASIAIHEHDGATETELEEAYIETIGLGNGVTVKAGRFFSGLGYLNGQHEHAWDFADAPLVYSALFGNRLADDGVQLRWLAPVDLFFEVGAEITRGDSFPSGENDGNEGQTLFAKLGGDLTRNTSWQIGVSAYRSEFIERSGEAHAHEHEHEGEEEAASFGFHAGEVSIAGVDAVFKWAPTGNSKAQQLILQAEYFQRNEEATLEFAEGTNSMEADYDGEQSGYYVQAVYRFLPAWRAGIRYDAIEADNTLTEREADGVDLEEFLEDTGFDNTDTISRRTFMVDYSRSEFSRIRFQYGYLDLPDNRDELFMIQYTMSLGSHGAHRF